MNVIATPSPGSATAATPTAVAPRCNVLVQDKIAVPGWVCDLESYRQWAYSDDYPQSGWVSFLDGDIYVDTSMEELLTHNQVKMAYAYSIINVLGSAPPGMFVGDRMLFTNPEANFTTEPDGLFFFWETAKSGRLRFIESAAGYLELSGTPDMVLGVVSKTSIRKDTVRLRGLYAKAKIPEYWLVDARGAEPQFEILRCVEHEYVRVEAVDGWLASSVFHRQFQIVKQTNPLGQPHFVVNYKELP